MKTPRKAPPCIRTTWGAAFERHNIAACVNRTALAGHAWRWQSEDGAWWWVLGAVALRADDEPVGLGGPPSPLSDFMTARTEQILFGKPFAIPNQEATFVKSGRRGPAIDVAFYNFINEVFPNSSWWSLPKGDRNRFVSALHVRDSESRLVALVMPCRL